MLGLCGKRLWLERLVGNRVKNGDFYVCELEYINDIFSFNKKF